MKDKLLVMMEEYWKYELKQLSMLGPVVPFICHLRTEADKNKMKSHGEQPKHNPIGERS